MTEKAILKAITVLFLQRVKKNPKGGYWTKWIGNWQLAKIKGWDVKALRKLCTQMEAKGLLQRGKGSNMVMWACAIPGYKQHKFVDYYEPEL